jgi:hypothetical protein
MSSRVAQLQADLFALISAEAYFSDIVVYLNNEGLSASDIATAIKCQVDKDGKKGAAVIVDEVLRDVPNPDPMGPNFRLILPVGVYVHPGLNFGTGGTGKTIDEITDEICNAVHGRKVHPNINQIHNDKTAVTPVVDKNGLKVREILFASSLCLAKPSRVATPTLSGNAAAVSITCNTDGAVIYYTTDGSYPWSGNSTATRFGYALQTESGIIITTEEGDEMTVANPFPVSAGTEVRAAAYKTATHQGSDATAATF